MSAMARKVAAFRQRLAARQASWAIDIPVRRRITLDLTREQQALLKRATNKVVPAVTLVLASSRLEPTGHALARLELRRPVTRARKQRKPGRRGAR